MPEVVKPAAQEQPFTGPGHYFLNQGALLRGVTVDRAMFATWFFCLNRAVQASLYRIQYKLSTLRAYVTCKIRYAKVVRFSIMVMMTAAPDLGELCQQSDILMLCV